jgi:hypothetical protein
LPTGEDGHVDVMLLIFGLHTSTRVLATLERACGRCGHRAPHRIVEASRRFTLFFIPVFRVGAATYLDACPVCGLETELTKAQALSAGSVVPPVGPQDAPVWSAPQDR